MLNGTYFNGMHGVHAPQTGITGQNSQTGQLIGIASSALQGPSSQSFKPLDPHRLNIVGESHPESGPRRDEEKAYLQSLGMSGSQYWNENEFQYSTTKNRFQILGISFGKETTQSFGDPVMLRLEMRLADVKEKFLPIAQKFAAGVNPPELGLNHHPLEKTWESFVKTGFNQETKQIILTMHELLKVNDEKAIGKLTHLYSFMEQLEKKYQNPATQNVQADAQTLLQDWAKAEQIFCADVKAGKPLEHSDNLSRQRSAAMAASAQASAQTVGVWKVGQSHINDIMSAPGFNERALNYNILTKDEFNQGLALWVQKHHP